MQARFVFTALATTLLLVAPFIPAAAAQDEEDDQAGYKTSLVTFYVHGFSVGAGGPVPGNTQYPFGEEDTSFGSGGGDCGPTSTAAILPDDGTGSSPTYSCDESITNLQYVYSTAGPVPSEKVNEAIAGPDDYAAFHNERGQTKDILFDVTKDITAKFYMSADNHGWFVFSTSATPGVPNAYPRWNWDPGFEPGWRVEATLMAMNLGEYQGQASDAPGIHPKVAGKEYIEIARGVTEPRDMISLDESSTGGAYQTVYEFNINLGKPKVDRIKKTDDWVMRFRWWSETSGNSYILGPNWNWNINNGEFYPSSFTIPVKNAFDVELVYPRFVYDKLVVLGLMNAPWGSYDMDGDSVELEIVNAKDNFPVAAESISKTADFSVAHGGHFKPINVTWVWDYQADKAKPGDYKVTVKACNHQHSACRATSAKFSILDGGLPGTTEIGRSGAASFTESDLDQQTGSPASSAESQSTDLKGSALVQPGLWASMLG